MRTLAPSFDEPLELLQTCHAHIEERLQALENLALHSLDSAAQSTANEVLRYFDTEGVQHHQDEDEDLFPLVRKRAAASGRSEVAAAVDELEREHATMDAQWRRLRAKLTAIAPSVSPAVDAGEVARFAWLYRRHMERESLLVLPFAREVLTPQERKEFGQRMAARRARP